ncbi:MAG: asparagine synthase [Gammaproteobacteria bacterium]|nr:asparagine synthase [Gammaproteobacteria bacterium]
MPAGTLFLGYFAKDRLKSDHWLQRADASDWSKFVAPTNTSSHAALHWRGIVNAEPSPSNRSIAALFGAPYPLGTRSEPLPSPVAIALKADRNPRAALAAIGGHFAFASIDSETREVVLAVDRFAIENLYYVITPDGIAFSNRSRLLAAHPVVRNRFSHQSLYNSVYFHWLPGPDAGYAGMQRLLPGHFLRWREGRVEIAPYWEPSFPIDSYSSEAAIAEQLRASIDQAVARRLPNSTPASFLSGGLDSSTVTGYAAKHRADTVAYTIGFEAQGYDEMEYARGAARHFGVRHESYYVTPADIVDALPAIIGEFDAPFGNASAIPTYYCAKHAASQGHRVILAGDGGDELFGGNERYAKQLAFEHYARLPHGLRAGMIEPMASNLPSFLQIGLLGKAASYIRQAAVPLPDRLMTYNLLNRVVPSTFFTPDFLASIDRTAPLRELRAMYAAPEGTSTVNRLLSLDWRITLADSDLPKVSRMCALAGIEVAYPMLDEAVVAVSCRIPNAGKVSARELRPLYRRAFKDFLPAATLAKSKQGFGLPFGVWLHEQPRLREFAHARLRGLEDRKILKAGFRDEFLSTKLNEHPAYYGTLAWILVALAVWVDSTGVDLI